MAGIKNPSMRDLPTDDGITPLSRWVDNLPDKKGSMDPSNPKHAPQIEQMAQAIAQGLLDAPRVEKLARLNERAAPILLQALSIQDKVKARQNEMGQYFNPGGEKTILPARGPMESYEGDGNELSAFPARPAMTQMIPAKADVQGATLAALKRGDLEYAKGVKEIFTKKDGEGPFAKINPKDYTPESVKAFQAGGAQDYSVLTHLDPDKATKEANKVFDHEAKLRGEYTKLSGTFLEVRDAFGRIEQAAKEPSAAGDIAVLTGYMKLIDPTTGVKEGEYANAANAAGVPEKVRNIYNKLLDGKVLGQDGSPTREDFVKQARGLFQRHQASQKKNEAQYRALSKRYGVNADRVVTDFNPDPEVEAPRAGPIGPNAEATKVIGGVTYIKRDGKWYQQ